MGEQNGSVAARPVPEQQQQAPISAVAPPYLWLSGRLVPWAAATVHITAVGWPAIGAVFEGIRGYWNRETRSMYIFRLDDHMRRFGRSMKLMRMQPDLSLTQIADGLCELFRANAVAEDAYAQPLAFVAGNETWSSRSPSQTPTVVITARPSPSALLSGRTSTAGVSSWTRISDNMLPPRIKALPNYANSRLASAEARRGGYDEPIFLNHRGTVSEGASSCLFMVRDGVAITPPTTASILESITRDAVIRLLRDMDVPVLEREMDRTELYICDEVFLCGTLMEVHPIVRVDGYDVGDGAAGPVFGRLARTFNDVVRGNDHRYAVWLTKV